jgi:hypothetical protein
MYDYDVYALIDDNNVVLNIIVGPKIENGLTEQSAIKELSAMHGGRWLLTNNARDSKTIYRKNNAGIGDTYDSELDAFIPIKPYPSWILNKETAQWEAPTPMPTEGEWNWDEEKLSWVQFSE